MWAAVFRLSNKIGQQRPCGVPAGRAAALGADAMIAFAITDPV